MLLILLGAAWLATILMVLALGRMAVRGDSQPAPFADRDPRSIGEALAIREEQAGPAFQDRRYREAGERLTPPVA